jgi:hypothetical protein
MDPGTNHFFGQVRGLSSGGSLFGRISLIARGSKRQCERCECDSENITQGEFGVFHISSGLFFRRLEIV